MTDNKLDARQSRSREILDQLQGGADAPVNSLLRATNKEVTPPLRMRVTASNILSIDTHLVTNPQTGRSHTIAPINGSFSPIPTYPITITIPSGTGTISNSTFGNGGNQPTITLGTANYYQLIGLAINGSGAVNISIGAEGSSLASASYPVFPNGYFAIGMFAVQVNSGATGWLALSDANVQQFSGGIAAAILNPMTSLGDIIYGDAIGTPLRLGITTGGSPTPANNGAILEVTSGGIPGWTHTIHNNKTFDSMVSVQGILKVGSPNTRTEQFSTLSAASGYTGWIANTTNSTGYNGLSVAISNGTSSSIIQQWLRLDTQNVGQILGTGTWNIGSSGGSQSHVIYGTLQIQQGTSTGNQLITSVGSAANPAYSSTVDSTSGIWFNGVHEVNTTINGTSVISITNGSLRLTGASPANGYTGSITIDSTAMNIGHDSPSSRDLFLYVAGTTAKGIKILRSTGIAEMQNGLVVSAGNATISNSLNSSLTVKTITSGHEAGVFFINGTNLKWEAYMPASNNDHLNFYSYTLADDVLSLRQDGSVVILNGPLLMNGNSITGVASVLATGTLETTSTNIHFPNIPTIGSGASGVRVVYYDNATGTLRRGPTTTVP